MDRDSFPLSSPGPGRRPDPHPPPARQLGHCGAGRRDPRGLCPLQGTGRPGWGLVSTRAWLFLGRQPVRCHRCPQDCCGAIFRFYWVPPGGCILLTPNPGHQDRAEMSAWGSWSGYRGLLGAGGPGGQGWEWHLTRGGDPPASGEARVSQARVARAGAGSPEGPAVESGKVTSRVEAGGGVTSAHDLISALDLVMR